MVENNRERTFFSKGTDSEVIVNLATPLWKLESIGQRSDHRVGEGALPTAGKWEAKGTLLFDVGSETLAIFVSKLRGEWKLEGYIVTLKHEHKGTKKVARHGRKGSTSYRMRRSWTLRRVQHFNIGQER